MRVDTSFRGRLVAAVGGTVLIDFLAEYKFSLELCLLRLCTSRIGHSGPLFPMRFCLLYHCVLPMHSWPSVRLGLAR
jgi:hypothetical protein